MPPEIPSSRAGWRLPSSRLSLHEVHGSITIPAGAGFWRKLFAFAGPGYLVAVGEVLLVHVADGWAARHFDELKLRESEEMQADRAYLERIRDDLASRGVSARTALAMGDPATELIHVAEAQGVDLIAMSTHGHRFLSDLLHGTTADRVRHLVKVPVLLLRAQ